MTVFKAPNLIDKQVETCHIRLEAEASEILFILKYKNSITKTHLLPILDCEVLQVCFLYLNDFNMLSVFHNLILLILYRLSTIKIAHQINCHLNREY